MGNCSTTGASSKYANLSVDSLERERSHYQQIMDRNRVRRLLDPNSDSARARRVQKAAERAYDDAAAKVEEIDRALVRARRRRRDIPF